MTNQNVLGHHWLPLYEKRGISQIIFFYVPQKKESLTSLKQHEGK